MSSADSGRLAVFLRQCHPMPETVSAALAAAFELQQWDGGDLLVQEAKTARDYHLVATGWARAFTIDTEGCEVTTDFFGPFDVATELSSFFLREPAGESLSAVGALQTWTLSFERLNALFHAEPHFRELGRALLVRAHARLHARTLAALHRRADVRYTQLMQDAPDLLLLAPLKQIASYLGVTDSSLSRIRRESTPHPTGSSSRKLP